MVSTLFNGKGKLAHKWIPSPIYHSDCSDFDCSNYFFILDAVINWLNKQMNEQMLGRAPLATPVGFPPRTSAQPHVAQGALSSSAGHTLSSIRPSPAGGPILQSQRHSLPLPTTTGTAGFLGVPRPQLQHRVSYLLPLTLSPFLACSLTISLSPSLPPSLPPLLSLIIVYMYKPLTFSGRSQAFSKFVSLFLYPAASVQQHSFPPSNLWSKWPASSSSTAGTRLSGQPRECPTTPGPVPRSCCQEKCNSSSISIVLSLSVR